MSYCRELTPEEYDKYDLMRVYASVYIPWIVSALYAIKPLYIDGQGTFSCDKYGRVYLSFDGDASHWSIPECASVLIHELMHILRGHTEEWRKNPVWLKHSWMTPDTWNIATDLEINSDLVDIPDIHLPVCALYPQNYGLECYETAEFYAGNLPHDGEVDSEISLDAVPEHESMCNGEVDSEISLDADVILPRLSSSEIAEVKEQTAHNIMSCHKTQGLGHVSPGLLSWAKKTITPEVPWQKILSSQFLRVLDYTSRGTYPSYSRINRRAENTDIIPGKISARIDVMVGIDTSASMGNLLTQAVAELENIFRHRNITQIRYFSVDTSVGLTRKLQRSQTITLSGGGGTDMTMAYQYVSSLTRDQRPTHFVLITDGYTPWPDAEQKIPRIHYIAIIIDNDDPRAIPSWITPIYISPKLN